MKKLTWILLLLVLPSVAQPPAKFSAVVELNVSSSDDSLRNEVNSFLKRVLRSLGDVILVDDKGDLVISVVASKITTKAGIVVGFSMATLITRTQKATILADPFYGLMEKLGDWKLNFLTVLLSGGSYIYKFSLRSGSMDDVQDICKSIIADFDTETLDSDRKWWNTSHKTPPADKPK